MHRKVNVPLKTRWLTPAGFALIRDNSGLFSVLVAVLIFAFPCRAPQDLLLGTHLVPK
jgi:hypothetical protein